MSVTVNKERPHIEGGLESPSIFNFILDLFDTGASIGAIDKKIKRWIKDKQKTN